MRNILIIGGSRGIGNSILNHQLSIGNHCTNISRSSHDIDNENYVTNFYPKPHKKLCNPESVLSEENSCMFLSIIIPIYNEEKNLKECFLC